MAVPARSRSVAFVDWSNVYLGAKNYHKTRVDPMKLRACLGRGRNLTSFHYFSSVDPASTGQSRFLGVLARAGIIVHTQVLESRPVHLLCPNCRSTFDPVCPSCKRIVVLPPHKSKMVDVDLALNMAVLSGDYEEAVLVTGDKDFLPVVEWLRRERSRMVSLYAWRDSFSGLFVGKVDRVTYLDDILAEIED